GGEGVQAEDEEEEGRAHDDREERRPRDGRPQPAAARPAPPVVGLQGGVAPWAVHGNDATQRPRPQPGKREAATSGSATRLVDVTFSHSYRGFPSPRREGVPPQCGGGPPKNRLRSDATRSKPKLTQWRRRRRLSPPALRAAGRRARWRGPSWPG